MFVSKVNGKDVLWGLCILKISCLKVILFNYSELKADISVLFNDLPKIL